MIISNDFLRSNTVENIRQIKKKADDSLAMASI